MFKPLTAMFFRLLALALLFLSVEAPALARTVVDDLNRSVDVSDTVNRVVVADIYPLASALTMYLGGPEKIVGIHPVSMAAIKGRLLSRLWPEMTKIDTSFMKGTAANIEALLSLEPDVVFVNANNAQLIDQLDNVGIPALAVATNKYDYDVLKTFNGWMALMQSVFPERQTAGNALAYSQKIVNLVARKTADIAHKKRVLFLVNYDSKRIVTSGRHFFGQFWADKAGAVNAAESIEAKGGNAVINMETVYAMNPEAVFITNFTKAMPKTLYTNAIDDWTSVKAVQTHSVYKMPLGLYRSYTPAADSPLTLLWIAKTLYPEAFADVDMVREAQNFYREVFGIDLSAEDARSLYGVKDK